MPRPKPSEIVRLLQPNPDLQRSPNDIIPGRQREPDIGDKDVLSEQLRKSFREDIQQREDFGFQEKQFYNEKSYYEVKDEFFSNWPWPHAYNIPEIIVPVFVDVGWTQIQGAMFRNLMKTVNVSGVGREDKPYASLIAHILNWENGIENEIYDVQGMNAFRMFKNGTGFVKTWLDIGDEFKIKHASIPMHLIYKPIKGNGCQRDKCSHYHQLIPMDENDWKFRKGLKIDGKTVYENLDMIAPGFEPSESLMGEELRMLQNQITGMDVEGMESRSLRYMVESHYTYYPPERLKAVELIVWWSLRHGLIHRTIENDTLIRPMSDYWVYPSDGYAYQRSLPEILRSLQDDASYTKKQTADAADIAISPPVYIDKQSDFGQGSFLRVPTGMYQVEKGTNIQTEQRNIAAIIERGHYLDKLWDKAKIRSGFTDIFLGIEGERQTTLGGDRIRLSKAENRFQHLLNTYGIGWRRTCEIQYDLTNRAIPRKKLIQVLGSADYTNVNQLFPRSQGSDFGMGLDRKFNFALAGKSQSEQDAEDQDALTTTGEILQSPFGMSKVVAYKCLKKRAEVRNFMDFETILSRPPEADILSIEEVLQRIESGEIEVHPSPLTDQITAEYYLFRIGVFKKSDRYSQYSSRQRIILERYAMKLNAVRQSVIMSEAEKKAESDPAMAMALDSLAEDAAQGRLPGQNGQMMQ